MDRKPHRVALVLQVGIVAKNTTDKARFGSYVYGLRSLFEGKIATESIVARTDGVATLKC